MTALAIHFREKSVCDGKLRSRQMTRSPEQIHFVPRLHGQSKSTIGLNQRWWTRWNWFRRRKRVVPSFLITAGRKRSTLFSNVAATRNQDANQSGSTGCVRMVRSSTASRAATRIVQGTTRPSLTRRSTRPEPILRLTHARHSIE
jgi:hypothetical protein